MRVHRLIFRLDFKRPCFDMIDYPGRIMRTLGEMGNDYWPEFQDAAASRTIAGKAYDKDSKTYRQITVEPTELNFVFESVGGMALGEVLTNDTVGTLFKGVHALCDAFKINSFSRAGVRFFVLANLPAQDTSLVARSQALIDQNLLNNVATTIGEIRDVGLAFDGEATDGLSYHFRMGPYLKDEGKNIFTADIGKEIESAELATNFIADIDFYEQDFEMTIKASQWSKAPINKSEKLLDLVRKLMSNEV